MIPLHEMETRSFGEDMQELTTSNEDYLEAIVMLGGASGAVRSIDIAEKMGVSKTSVSKAIAVLKDRGFIEQPHYGSIELTPEGLAYGNEIYARHKALTRFLEKAVGLEHDVAESQACMMEHAIDDASFEKWMTFIDSLDL